MRMILFLTLSLVALSASAQESKWSYGVTLVPSYLSYWTVNSDDVLEYRGRANFGLGFSLSHHLSDNLSVFFNPEFHTRNFREIIDADALQALDPNDPVLISRQDIEFRQFKSFIDLSLGIDYLIGTNFLVKSSLTPSFLIAENVKDNNAGIRASEKRISEFNMLWGIGPGFTIDALKGWDFQCSPSINVFLKQFHDFFPEENPILFQVKFALIKSRD